MTNFTLYGAGDTPASVTLLMMPNPDCRSFFKFAVADKVTVGNLTLDGRHHAEAGIRAATAQKSHFSNLVLRNIDFASSDPAASAIHIGLVASKGGIVVSNNTIVHCRRGITILGVAAKTPSGTHHIYSKDNRFQVGPDFDAFSVYRGSFIENNIVYNYTDHGIQIGQAVSRPVRGAQESDYAYMERVNAYNANVAGAWSPFADWDNDGLPDVDTPNPMVPVRNNWVWRTDAQGIPNADDSFVGSLWYTDDGATGYGPPQNRLHGEAFSDPGFVDSISGDFRLSTASPAKGAGSPFRIDAIQKWDPVIGEMRWYGMQRSLGAFESTHPSDYAIPLE